MGAYFVLFPRSRVLILVPIPFFLQVVEAPAVAFLALWFLMQLFGGLGTLSGFAGGPGGGLAFWAHVASFVAGAIAVLALRRPERQRIEWWDLRR